MSGEAAESPRRPLAVVTGGSSGIGAAVVETLARQGYDVVVHLGRDTAGAERAARRAHAHGARAITVAVDLEHVGTPEEFWGPVTQRVRAELDEVLPSVLVLNAGVDRRLPLEDYPEAEVRRLLAVNLLAPLAILQGVGERTAADAVVVAVSSSAARVPLVDSLPYSASKAALETLVTGMARDPRHAGRRFTVVAPGPVDTPMQSPERLERLRAAGLAAAPEAIADVVALLVSDGARWVNGQVVEATGRPL